jgi:hypothetical protein
MSYLVEIAGMAAKAVGSARAIARMRGHDAPVLDELHQALGPIRRKMTQEKATAFAAGPGAAQPQQSADWTDDNGPGIDAGGDVPAVDGGGFFADVVEWISDQF